MNYVRSFSSARMTLMALLCAAPMAFSPLISSAQNDPPQQAGRISFIEGSASVQPVGIDDWGQAEVNMPLGPGDRIYTDDSSRAEIQIGRTYIRLGVGTDVSVIDVTPDGISIGIAQGRIRVHCYGLWPGQTLHVNTPSGSTTLNSPGEFRVDVYPDQPAALFTQYASSAFVTGAGDFSSQLPAGNALELTGSNPVVPQWMEMPAPEVIDSWSQQRDGRIENAISYRYVSSDLGGAYDLDASGDWAPQSPYGAIWFPRVEPGWAPYRNGHWVSHAPWGWVWVEEESWGYTPFHYGRWVVFNGRWGWIPGPIQAHPVWSPALVVFAGGVGGGGVSAWFPLGPGEPYRPWYPCSPRYIDQVNISNLRPAPGIRIQASYSGFNFGAVAFANRSAGIVAMRQEDFAAGRRVRESTVVINRTVINNITIINRPPVEPNPRVFASRAPMRPVPLAAARPTIINEHGMVVSARVGFRPAAPPERPVPQVQTMPGHRMVAPPPGVRMTGGRGNAGGAPGRPGQQQPTQVTPEGRPAVSGPGNPNRGTPNQGAPNQGTPNRGTPNQGAPNQGTPNQGTPNQGGQGPHPNSTRPSELTARPAPNQPMPMPPAPKPREDQGARPAPNQPMQQNAPRPAGQGSNPNQPPAARPVTPNQPPAARPAPNPNQKPGAKPDDKSKQGDKDKPKKDHPDSSNN